MALQLSSIQQKLQQLASESGQLAAQRFHKENIVAHGIKMPVVRALAKEWFREMKTLEKKQVFALCDALFQTGVLEEAMVAIEWTYLLKRRYEEQDLATFERWLGSYIHSWSTCDNFCNNTVGAFLLQYPSLVKQLSKWARSGNRWLQRGAAVSLIVPARQGKFLQESLAIAELEMNSTDDLVQKGYGWLLKVASKPHFTAVYDFVKQHRHAMPRTALRYAIEHFPEKQRGEMMGK